VSILSATVTWVSSPPAATADLRDLARSSPAGFAWYASQKQWIPAPHLLLLSEKIVDVATGRIPRLMVFMPPRHGKSELISKYAPAWFLGTFPNKKVMLASYADTFAASWGRRARDLLEEYSPTLWPSVRVNQESKSGAHWELARPHEGVMVTAGVGGGITGKGAHFMVIDDPVKNADEAHSEKIRQAHMDWWQSTARTRLQGGAGVILVMTRWHEDDLAGRLLADEKFGGDHWEVLKFPGLCEEVDPARNNRDPLGRAIGDPLWPSMFDEANLRQTEKAMGEYWFSAMYQQRPAPLEGALFKRDNFRYFEWKAPPSSTNIPDHPGFCTLLTDDGPSLYDLSTLPRFTVMDVAASEKQAADYTVALTCAMTPTRDLIVLDLQRVQFSGPDVPGLARNVFHTQKPAIMGIESFGFGLLLVQTLIREGFPIRELKPDKDKVARALPAVARTEAHTVYLPKGAHWLDPFLSEVAVFPNGAHDDQVDTLAYAVQMMQDIPTGLGRYKQRSKGKMITGGLLNDPL
jgi:predicted phage terminase large subunit-like protein